MRRKMPRADATRASAYDNVQILVAWRHHAATPARYRVMLETPTPGIAVPEAAIALNVSAETVRRRLRDGRLTGYRVNTTTGHEWRVVLEQPTAQPPPEPVVNVAATPVPSEEITALRDHVSTLKAEVLRLQAHVAHLQADNAAKTVDAGRLVEALTALTVQTLPKPRAWWKVW